MIVIPGARWSGESRSALLDAVHDRWFNLEDVTFDQAMCKVRVRIGDSRHGPFERELTFSGVDLLEIEDEAAIQFYDIDDISIDAAGTHIVLASGFPLRLMMHLGADWHVSCDEPR